MHHFGLELSAVGEERRVEVDEGEGLEGDEAANEEEGEEGGWSKEVIHKCQRWRVEAKRGESGQLKSRRDSSFSAPSTNSRKESRRPQDVFWCPDVKLLHLEDIWLFLFLLPDELLGRLLEPGEQSESLLRRGEVEIRRTSVGRGKGVLDKEGRSDFDIRKVKRKNRIHLAQDEVIAPAAREKVGGVGERDEHQQDRETGSLFMKAYSACRFAIRLFKQQHSPTTPSSTSSPAPASAWPPIADLHPASPSR